VIKVLLLADTHLGFDLPSRPRSERRRRGPDFFAMTRLARWEFRELPARPMAVVTVDASRLDAEALEARLRQELEALPADAVVQLRIEGELGHGAETALRAGALRRLLPPTMSLNVRGPAAWRRNRD
jgi:DNA repair exonuclease SbcCD nuclease subunit